MGLGLKKDQTARLLKVEHLLYGNPRGLKPQELARRCGVCVRTTYCDLIALEQERGLVLWEDDGRNWLERSMFLPPLKLTLLEAMALFLGRTKGAQCEVYPSLALGEDVRLEGDGVVGSTLVYRGMPVHVSLFRIHRDRRASGARGGIARASVRRRLR